MTERELYKKLKEKKLFSLYCIVIANGFWKENTARGYKDGYVGQSLDLINNGMQTIENYIHYVSTWTLNKYGIEIKIQQ